VTRRSEHRLVRLPAGAHLTGRSACLLAGVLATVSASACGPPPPQAPVSQANRVASALAGIGEACGESYQERASPVASADTSPIEAAAAMRARELAEVYRMNPRWIYQGETLRQIVALSIAYLRECRLSGAATALQRETTNGVSRSS
jgi:hypothetical protein